VFRPAKIHCFAVSFHLADGNAFEYSKWRSNQPPGLIFVCNTGWTRRKILQRLNLVCKGQKEKYFSFFKLFSTHSVLGSGGDPTLEEFPNGSVKMRVGDSRTV
jgi:hypothetical protein